MKFKDQGIQSLVSSTTIYGNLVINDISDLKTEKPREDGKCSRKYYVAYPQSAENSDAARGVTMWQDHNSDGTSAVWKKAPNPARVRRIVDAGDDFTLSGVIVKVDLNRGFQVGDREVFKTTLYCPHESMIEAELKSFLQEVSLLEKEGAKAEN